MELEQQLQRQYVQTFSTTVLTPVDEAITRRLLGGSDVIPLVFLLITRTELLNHCLSPAGCPGTLTSTLQADDYQLMLAHLWQEALPQERGVHMLKDAYEAYLRWSFGVKMFCVKSKKPTLSGCGAGCRLSTLRRNRFLPGPIRSMRKWL
jgi:hypothetical protein